MKSQHFMLGLILLASSCAIAQVPAQTAPAAPQTVNKPVKATATPRAQHHEDDGDRIFQQNCARCHTSPGGFPPSVSGTITRHMRVRASLSQEDEQKLLKYFNP